MRCMLLGGGSWLQEGIATYFASMDMLPALTASIKDLLACRDRATR